MKKATCTICGEDVSDLSFFKQQDHANKCLERKSKLELNAKWWQ